MFELSCGFLVGAPLFTRTELSVTHRENVVKYVTLNEGELEGGTHVVVKTSLSEREKGRGREFVLFEWCQNRSLSLDLPFWGEEKCVLLY